MLAAVLALAAVVANGQTGPDVQPAVMVGDDLIRVFQEGKDAAEQADPPEEPGPRFRSAAGLPIAPCTM